MNDSNYIRLTNWDTIPEVLLKKCFKGHNNCSFCSMYGRVYSYKDDDQACEECFNIILREEFLEEQNKELTEIRKVRLVDKYEQKIKKRIRKGRCPVRLRE